METAYKITNQHDDNVCVGMVPQLSQPPLDVLVGEVFRDVVHQQGTHSTAIISATLVNLIRSSTICHHIDWWQISKVDVVKVAAFLKQN